ncbi:type II toxin-antitoxin system RelE/ParE family toxin [Luteimonas sp. SJ-92]|uniref:Type II toxin-antitoxin system RelE/ParE family toxin n=1 Tax=Luteimonas salinisoli TaxID=2752307 RepID=A0A853JCD3_9GAMM|nr:type II toxin-antitoxin system RelE/ParE family toxin [Luteimonas salinisoli]
MAERVSSQPALSDLEAIADYIALEHAAAAAELAARIIGHVEQLAERADKVRVPTAAPI